MNLKEEAARAAAGLIKENTVVGLGDGSTIGMLVKFLLQKITNGMRIELLTSSSSTHQLLVQSGLTVLPVNQFKRMDIYFDGCDQVDKDLNALKSGGGIHTMEKLFASMADQFVLIGDESKFVDQFDRRFPVVLEVLPQATGYVAGYVQEQFPLSTAAFRNNVKENHTITGNGNYLLDVWLSEWPNLAELSNRLKAITGVVETSLFYNLASKAIIAAPNGVQVLTRQLS